MKRAKKSSAKDYLGLLGIIVGVLLLIFLMIENYMGYTGLQRLIQKKYEKQQVQQKLRKAKSKSDLSQNP